MAKNTVFCEAAELSLIAWKQKQGESRPSTDRRAILICGRHTSEAEIYSLWTSFLEMTPHVCRTGTRRDKSLSCYKQQKGTKCFGVGMCLQGHNSLPLLAFHFFTIDYNRKRDMENSCNSLSLGLWPGGS